jgi:hypothetical protein
MTLSGPKLCLGSTKDAKILPAFLHSPADCEMEQEKRAAVELTPHGGRQRVVDTERHLEGLTGTEDIDGVDFSLNWSLAQMLRPKGDLNS